MTLRYRSPDARWLIDPRLVHKVIATTLAGVLVFLSASFAGADTLTPREDTGGSGAVRVSIAEMLRGDYSPVPATQEIAVTEAQAANSVAEMIRGEHSPVDTGTEIAVTEPSGAVSVAEMIRGDQSPITV